MCGTFWDDLLMSLSVTQRAMLHASEAKAASASGVVIAFDYEIVCQRAANDQDLQLTLHNQISRMISDYAPQAVFITKEAGQSYDKNLLLADKPSIQAN